MKNSILLFTAIIISSGIYAQKKPKINQAENAWRDGDLAAAKEIVDQGIVHEKTKDDSKTWFIRGLVYSAIDTTSNKELASLSPTPLKVAVEAFNKATELQKGDNENFVASPGGFPILQSQVVEGLWAYNLNTGISNFQNDDASGAIDYFEKAQILISDSIDSYYFAGLAAISTKEYDKALSFLTTYIDKGGDDEDAYIRALYVLNDLQKKPEEALKLSKRAKEKFPASKSISEWNFRILFALDRVDEAIEELRAATLVDPENAVLHLNLGIMLDEAGKSEEAEMEFKKAYEKDPEYYDAVYSLARIYTNKIVDLSKEKNDLGISKEDQAKTKKLEAEIKELSSIALPYWEKANELQPDDRTTLNTLQYLYMQAKDYDKAEAVTTRMEELGFDN